MSVGHTINFPVIPEHLGVQSPSWINNVFLYHSASSCHSSSYLLLTLAMLKHSFLSWGKYLWKIQYWAYCCVGLVWLNVGCGGWVIHWANREKDWQKAGREGKKTHIRANLCQAAMCGNCVTLLMLSCFLWIVLWKYLLWNRWRWSLVRSQIKGGHEKELKTKTNWTSSYTRKLLYQENTNWLSFQAL